MRASGLQRAARGRERAALVQRRDALRRLQERREFRVHGMGEIHAEVAVRGEVLEEEGHDEKVVARLEGRVLDPARIQHAFW